MIWEHVYSTAASDLFAFEKETVEQSPRQKFKFLHLDTLGVGSVLTRYEAQR